MLGGDDLLTITRYIGGKNTRISKGLKEFYNVNLKKVDEE